jgi:hypothetical protein
MGSDPDIGQINNSSHNVVRAQKPPPQINAFPRSFYQIQMVRVG